MYKSICIDCEKVFEAKSKRAFICPECHRKRLSVYAKERQLNQIGNDAYSKQQEELKGSRP